MSFAPLFANLPPKLPASPLVRDIGSALPTHHFLLFHRYGYRRFEAVDMRSKSELLREGAWTGLGLAGAVFEKEEQDYPLYLEVCLKMELGTPLSLTAYKNTFGFFQDDALYFLREKREQCGLLILSNILHLSENETDAGNLWKAAIRGLCPGGLIYLVTADTDHAYAAYAGRFILPGELLKTWTSGMTCLHYEKDFGLHIGLWQIRSE